MEMPQKDQAPCNQPQCVPQPGDFDFDVSRTFIMLTVTLVLPVYLALSVVSFSMGAMIT